MNKNKLEFINEQTRIPLAPALKLLLTAAVQKTLYCTGNHFPASVTLTLTTDPKIHALNKTYRQIDKATDVLSFPLLHAGEPGKPQYGVEDTEDGYVCLGDIVISCDHAVAQAKEYGHSVRREIAFLTVHSLLHLLGYDHIEEDDRVKMRAKEEEILSALGVARS